MNLLISIISILIIIIVSDKYLSGSYFIILVLNRIKSNYNKWYYIEK